MRRIATKCSASCDDNMSDSGGSGSGNKSGDGYTQQHLHNPGFFASAGVASGLAYRPMQQGKRSGSGQPVQTTSRNQAHGKRSGSGGGGGSGSGNGSGCGRGWGSGSGDGGSSGGDGGRGDNSSGRGDSGPAQEIRQELRGSKKQAMEAKQPLKRRIGGEDGQQRL